MRTTAVMSVVLFGVHACARGPVVNEAQQPQAVPPSADSVGVSEPEAEPEPTWPESFRWPHSVAMSCSIRGEPACEEWLESYPLIGKGQADPCRLRPTWDGPCPTEGVVGICDESELAGHLRYFYAPMTTEQARERCQSRFWSSLPEPGHDVAVVDRTRRVEPGPGCASVEPPPLVETRVCLDLPSGMPSLRRIGVRDELGPRMRDHRVTLEHWTGDAGEQVVVYRKTPVEVRPLCPGDNKHRQVNRDQDAHFVQYETEIVVPGETLVLRCSEFMGQGGSASEICNNGRLRWCAADEP